MIPGDKFFPVATVKAVDSEEKPFYLQRIPIGMTEIVGENVTYKGEAGTFPENIQIAISQSVKTAKKTKKNVSLALETNKIVLVKDAIPFLLHVDDPISIKTEVILEQKTTDTFDLFRELLSETEGSLITCKPLNQSTIEAQLISRMFCSTFGGAQVPGGPFGGGARKGVG